MIEGFCVCGKSKGGNVRVDTGKDGGAIFRDGVVGVGDRLMEAGYSSEMISSSWSL
jgi:hypothetical protein